MASFFSSYNGDFHHFGGPSVWGRFTNLFGSHSPHWFPFRSGCYVGTSMGTFVSIKNAFSSLGEYLRNVHLNSQKLGGNAILLKTVSGYQRSESVFYRQKVPPKPSYSSGR